ncbi:hypothetical protein BYT27DRAFT_7188371 [Phlegmacium glaucopus]|nr:hypothetical protein BYT27DRAFT_7188371 [Phlegmacium glaucopus]
MQLHCLASFPISSLLFLFIVEDLEPLRELSDENHVETEKQLHEALGHPNSRPTSKD